MVRTRYKSYADVQQESHQTAQAQAQAVVHVGKRRNGLFHRFQDLPCELRLMVWKAALTPRLVAIIPRSVPKVHDKARDREIGVIRGIPALLAVNQEARYLALRHYTWRFTLDVCIFQEAPRTPERRRARVVMSPDDTLGLFRRNRNADYRGSILEVKVANEKTSPWKIHQTTDAPRGQACFKKVAVLGEALESNLKIVRALNITTWDLDAILHDQSTVTRTARSPYTKHKITIASAEMAQFFPVTQPYRAVVNAISDLFQPVDGKEPDIMTFVLADGQNGLGWSFFLSILSGSRFARPKTRYAVRRPPRW